MDAGRGTLTRAGEVTAQLTLVVAPVLAFNALRLPGIVTLAMVVPGLVLVAAYVTTPGLRVPTWEFLLVGLLLLSVAWGDVPAYSVERLRTFAPLVLSAVLAGCLVDPGVVLRSLKAAFAIIIGSSLLTLILDPVTVRRSPGSNLIAIHAQFDKNEYGGLLVFALVLLLGRRRRANVVLIPALIVLIGLNRSVTAWVIGSFLVFFALSASYIVGRLGARAGRLVTATVVLAGLGVTLLLGRSLRDSALLAVGKDTTLSDRTEIWAACWEEIKKAPFLGHGAYTFLNPDSGSVSTINIWAHFRGYRPPHPHNGTLDVLGQIGLVGLVCFAVLVVGAWVRASRGAVRGAEPASVALLGLTFLLLFGATEPTYLGPWLVLALACVAMAQPPTLATSPSDAPARREPELV